MKFDLTKVDKDWTLFYGILAGDGCISVYGRHKTISITCNIHDDKPFFDNIVIPLVNKIRQKSTKYRERPIHGKIEINFSDIKLFEDLKFLGFPIGKKGTKIRIPDSIPKNLWKNFVAGLFATDGCLAIVNNNNTLYPRIEIRSISFPMLDQTRNLLKEYGMKGNVYSINKGCSFRLEFPGKNNMILFRDKIGFINPKHEEKFNRFMDPTRIELATPRLSV